MSVHRGSAPKIARGDGDVVEIAMGRLCSRPVYVAHNPAGYHVHTTLREAAQQTDGVDPIGLAGRAMFYGSPQRVPAANVVRLAGGRRYRVDAGGIHDLGRNDDAISAEPDDASAQALVTPAAAANAVWEAVCAAVERATHGARTIAVMAGGGVDSSGLLAAACAIASGRRVVPLAWQFGGEGDDRPYGKELFALLNLEPHKIEPNAADEFVRNSLVFGGGPYGLVAGALEIAAMTTARKLGADVVLMGMGGDELLAGHLQASVWASKPSLRGAASAAMRAVRLKLPNATSARERIMGFVVRPWARTWVPAGIRGRLRAAGVSREARVVSDRVRASIARNLADAAPSALPATARERYSHFADSEVLEEYGDLREQLETHTGMRREDPYLDEQLLEVIARIPPRLMTSGDRHRGLFREAIRGKVPLSIVNRMDKACFDDLLMDMLDREGMRDRFLQSTRNSRLAELDIVDASRFNQAAKDLLDVRDPAAFALKIATLWPMFAAEEYARGR